MMDRYIINKDIIIDKSLNIQLNSFYITLFVVILHFLFSVFILPCGALSIIYGNVLGLSNGIFFSFTISFLCTILTFYLAQTKFNPFLFYNLERCKSFIIKNVHKRESTIIILSFLNPLFPGSSLGYVFGLIKINKIKFFMLSFIGLIPLNFIMVLIGHSLIGI